MFSRLSAWQELRLVQFVGLVIIVAMITILWTKGWYEKSDNINGIIVEVHGALFEFLFLSLLIEWYTKKRNQIQNVDLVNTLCYLLYEAASSCLRKIDDDYISSEKRYVYFGERMSIDRLYDLIDFFKKDISLLSEIYSEIEEIRRNHSEGAEIILDSIRKVSESPIISVADKNIISAMVAAQEAATELILSLKRPSTVKNETKEKLIEDIFKESQLLVIQLLELKKCIEKYASRIETREEHSQSISRELLAMQEITNRL